MGQRFSDLDPATTLPGTDLIAVARVSATKNYKVTLARGAAARFRLDKTANYTIAAGDIGMVVRVDATGGAVTVKLPASAEDNDTVGIRKSDSGANKVTVQDNAGATDLAWLTSQNDRVWFVYWASAWRLLDWRIAPLVRILTSSGNYPLNPLTRRVNITGIGAGNGGGSGACGDNSSSRFGGGGGGAGGIATEEFMLADLGATSIDVTIGAGGTGGTGVTSGSGNAGGTAGVTQVAANSVLLIELPAGTGGGGGSTTTGTAGAAGGGLPASGNAGGASSVSASGGVGANNTNWRAASGGSAGGGIDTSSVARDGGAGNGGYRIGGTGHQSTAATAGTGGGAGGAGGNKAWPRGTGAGGGGGGSATGANGGAGGAGGVPGGGGGGGGATRNGFTSGAGGAGGRGEVWVIEYAS